MLTLSFSLSSINQNTEDLVKDPEVLMVRMGQLQEATDKEHMGGITTWAIQKLSNWPFMNNTDIIHREGIVEDSDLNHWKTQKIKE